MYLILNGLIQILAKCYIEFLFLISNFNCILQLFCKNFLLAYSHNEKNDYSLKIIHQFKLNITFSDIFIILFLFIYFC